MKTRFTPGPWQLMSYTLAGKEAINIPEHDNIAIVEGMNRKANAALIAAAPDIFEALEIAIRVMEDAIMHLDCKDELSIAHAAIQKARGAS